MNAFFMRKTISDNKGAMPMAGAGKAAISYTKEPGTWIMFLAAFASGAAAGGPRTITVIIFVSLLLLLLIKSPAVDMLRSGRTDRLPELAVLALPGFAGLAYSVWLYRPLALLYAAAAVLFALNYHFEKGRKFSPVYAEAFGMAIMGDVAVISASVAGGIGRHLYLWALFFLFYFASCFRVRYSGLKKYRTIGAVYSSALLLGSLAGAALGHPVLLVFLPLAEDVYSALKQRKLKFKQLGLLSTVKTLVFCALVVYLSR